MTKKHFNTLLAIVAVVVVVSSILVSQKTSDDGIQSGSLLVPDLKNQLSKVSGLKVQAAKEETLVELVRKVSEEGEVNWVVSNRSDYPGNFNQLKNLLTDLADAKLQEAKTKNPANYGSLGVNNITEDDSAALLLTISFEGDKSSVQLLVGKAAEKWNGHYVRFPDQPQSWLTDKRIELEKEASSWLQRDIVNISSGRVKSVVYTNPKGEALNVVKAAGDEDDFLIQGVPADRELSYDSIGNTIASAASFVKLDDVMPVTVGDAAKEGGVDFMQGETYTSVFRANNGLVLTANTIKVDDKAYVKFFASVDAEQVATFNEMQAESTRSENEGADAENTNASVDGGAAVAAETDTDTDAPIMAAEEEAAKINAKVNDWVYQISNYAYGSLTKEMDGLLKAKEEGES